jgi:hypothetical protein
MLVASIVLTPILTIIEGRVNEAGSLSMFREDTLCLHARGGLALTRFI